MVRGLSQAAAYLTETGPPCATYRARLADHKRALADLVPEPTNLPDDQAATIAAPGRCPSSTPTPCARPGWPALCCNRPPYSTQRHPPHRPDQRPARNLLARWRGEAGDATGAATAYAELLTDRLRVLGPDHPRTLTTRQELAHWRRRVEKEGM
jgi:hypothetical protein